LKGVVDEILEAGVRGMVAADLRRLQPFEFIRKEHIHGRSEVIHCCIVYAVGRWSTLNIYDEISEAALSLAVTVFSWLFC
jgi:hypothetical protein